MHLKYQRITTRRPGLITLSALAVLPLMGGSPLCAPACALAGDEAATQGKSMNAGAANVTGDSPNRNAPSDLQLVAARAPLDAPGSTPVPLTHSALTGIRLAPGAQTLGTPEQLASAGANLSRVARKYGIASDVQSGFVEFIAWAGS